jgi:ABC-type bacteriocin/lantibiotic exporter with double-glycine peptidase domain
MFRYFQRALTLLSAREKRRVYLILVTSAAAAVVQTLSMLAIMPFIILLANPELLQTSVQIMRLHTLLGVESYHELLVALGLFGIVVLTAGNMFIAFEQWLSHRFLCHLGHRVQKQALQKMLQKPYEYFLVNHSARLSDIVVRQVDRVVDGVIGTFIDVFSSLALAVFIVVMLLAVSLKTTLVTLFGLLVAYVVVFLLLRRRIESHGAELTTLSASTLTAVKETLDGIREIRTRRAEAYFTRRFEDSSLRMAKLTVHYGLMSYLPHFFLETVVFAGFIAVALYYVFVTADAGVSLSYIALYGIAVYRLVPALQGLFAGVSSIHHDGDAVNVLLRDHIADVPRVETKPLPKPVKEITLEQVTYRYEVSKHRQLNRINVTIPAGSSVCLFGPSGSGKTTILNLLIGLISPQEGRVLCDGIEIGPQTIASWRERIGYLPQQIYLFDDTLSSNIAFGVADDAVDQERVAEVGRIANLDAFVTTRLPLGYRTIIGEHGETLSGGQRQRVGISRTLYHDPDVLLFDESFTGLDAENRNAILDSLFELEGKTLVFSSHETAIASRCDKVVVIEHGRVIAEGCYAQLLTESPRFEQLASRIGREQGAQSDDRSG